MRYRYCTKKVVCPGPYPKARVVAEMQRFKSRTPAGGNRLDKPHSMMGTGNREKNALPGGKCKPPNDENKRKWPLWAPHNVYWLIDDLVHKVIETGYNKLNSLAKKLGMKTDICRIKLAFGVLLASRIPFYDYAPYVSPAFIACTASDALVALALTAGGRIESAGEDGTEVFSGNGFLKILRLPTLLSAPVIGAAGEYLSPDEFSYKRVMIRGVVVLGYSVAMYLGSDENGTGKKVKDALKQFVDSVKAAFVQKCPAGSKSCDMHGDMNG